MKKIFFSNLLWGSALSLVTLFFYFTATGLETAELKFYDFRARMSAASSVKNEIAIIEINDDSISKIGRWPWPRSKVADMLLWLSSSTARPSVIGLNILFSEPEKNSGVELGDYLKTRYSELVAEKKIKETAKDSDFLKIIDEARAGLDNDTKLAAAVAAAGNVVFPMFVKTGEADSKPEPEPQWLKKFAPVIAHSAPPADIQNEGTQITVPLEVLSSSAAGVGHINVFADLDGTVRREHPFIPYNRSFYPSFASEILRVRLKLTPQEVTLSPGALAVFGRNKIPLDQASSVLVAFNKSRTSFKHYSFYNVMNGKIVPEAFKDKIVLIGLTAQGVGTPYVTPVESNLQAVEFTANVIGDILEGRFISRPEWAFQTELGLIIFTGLFVIFLLPRLKAGLGAGLTALMLGSLAGAGVFLFTSKGMWLKTLYPAFLLIAGYIFIVSKRFFSTEKKKELIEVSAIETNKMLGLSFQGQGMLDLAFEKFRLCPVAGTMKDLLYNLALDFERTRQFNKAVAVYGHISVKDPAYKDIKDRMEMLIKASNGAVFGGQLDGKAGGDAAMLVAGSSAIPTLGRYEITKELGKGAMGIVYPGKDPKINPDPVVCNPALTKGIVAVIDKALKTNPDERYQTAGHMAEDIKNTLYKKPLSAEVTKTPAAGGRPVSPRHPSGLGGRVAGSQPAPAVQAAKPQAQISPALELTPRGNHDVVSPQPLGRGEGLELTMKVKPPVALAPGPQPKPEPAAPARAAQESAKPAPEAVSKPVAGRMTAPEATATPEADLMTPAGGRDFEKTLPLIYPEEENK